MSLLNYKKTIVSLSGKYDTDKKMNNGYKCSNGVYGHNYAMYYDELLKVLKVSNMLEIGVSTGLSIKMWDEYFDKKVMIYGIDISEKRFKRNEIETDNIKIFIGDQGDEKFLSQFSNISFDFIVDDGSHRMRHQQISFKILCSFFRSGGVYVIEDLHTSKKSTFYDSKNEVTTLDVIKALRDKVTINSNYLTNSEYLRLLNSIKNIELCENEKICFIEKI